MPKIFKFFLPLCLLFLFAETACPYIYVYEVVTADSTFQTVSKLTPVDFYKYNGGEDLIYGLKVLKVYPSDGFNDAVREYGLEARNVRYLPHTRPEAADNKSLKRMTRPYFWWR